MSNAENDKTWLLAIGAIALGSVGAITYLARRLTGPSSRVTVNPADLILDLPAHAGRSANMLQVDGAVNFRDIGGYYTVDGRQRVKPGQIYRSSALNSLTLRGAEQLAALGVQLVCDLRTDDEIRKRPDRIPGDMDIRYVHNPVAQDNPMRVLRAILFQRQQLGRIFAEAYKYDLIRDGAGYYGDALRLLADSSNRPAVIHCTAGKDRAGILTALLLGALDVPEDVIIADYTQSNRAYESFAEIAREDVKRVRFLGVREEDLQPVILADAAVLRGALTYIREHYGSLKTYLLGPAGLSEDTLELLRSELLESV